MSEVVGSSPLYACSNSGSAGRFDMVEKELDRCVRVLVDVCNE